MVQSVDSDPLGRLSSWKNVFVWPRRSGELLVHPAETGDHGIWLLTRGVETLALTIVPDLPLSISPELDDDMNFAEDTASALCFDFCTYEMGHVSFRAPEVQEAAKGLLQSWCD